MRSRRVVRGATAIGVLLSCAALWWLGFAGAHATLVIGTLSFSPDPPLGAAELQARLVLEDPGLVEVEDAVIFLELRRLPDAASTPAVNAQPDTEPIFISDRMPEVEAGIYQITLPTPALGAYVLSVRDRTYRQEEAVANLVITFAADTPIGGQPFVLPPTATGPASLGTWLVWLIGVPLVAGAVVTILVLRSGRKEEDEEVSPSIGVE